MSEETSKHGEIMHQLGKLEGKVDGIISRQETANGRTSKLEVRVESLEESRNKSDGAKMNWRELLGWFTGVAGVITAVIALWMKK